MAEDIAGQVKRITALMLCFPELSRVRLDGDQGTLCWDVFLHYRVPEQELRQFMEASEARLRLLLKVRKLEPEILNIQSVCMMEQLNRLEQAFGLGNSELEVLRWTRDVKSLTYEELSCHHGMVQEQFLGRLVQGDSLSEQEQEQERTVLLEGLEGWKRSSLKGMDLIGVRDDFQISVYER